MSKKHAYEQQGIQKLLQAESEAQKIVEAARKNRSQRLKQAREEADSEIKRYQKQRQEEFKRYEEDFLGNTKGSQHKLDAETDDEIAAIKRETASNKQQVINMLLGHVKSVDTTVEKVVGQ